MHQWDKSAPEVPKLVPAVDERGETVFPLKFVLPSEVKTPVAAPTVEATGSENKGKGEKDTATQDGIEEDDDDDVL